MATHRDLLVNRLDAALSALPFNNQICPNCYKSIRPVARRPLPINLLDELTAAANERSPISQSPTPPPSPPASRPLPNSPPSPPSPPLPSHLH